MHKKYSSLLFTGGFLVGMLVLGGTLADAAAPDTATVTTVAAPVVNVARQEPIARVNGAVIDAAELRRAKKVMLRGQSVSPEQEKDLDQQAVERLISAEILYQAAVKQEIKDLDKQIDDKLAQGKSQFKDEQEFKKAIMELEMDEKALREYTRRDLLISSFVETEFVAKVAIPEAESRSFYDANVDKFKNEESVKASHILVGFDAGVSEDDKKKALDKATQLRKELVGGADFASLAKANSTCPSGQQGGDLGFFGKGQMVPTFEKAAFALKPGEISDVVETQFGYHIIRLTEKNPASTTSFKNVKKGIEEYLKGQKVNETIQNYLTEARKTSEIEILLK